MIPFDVDKDINFNKKQFLKDHSNALSIKAYDFKN